MTAPLQHYLVLATAEGLVSADQVHKLRSTNAVFRRTRCSTDKRIVYHNCLGGHRHLVALEIRR